MCMIIILKIKVLIFISEWFRIIVINYFRDKKSDEIDGKFVWENLNWIIIMLLLFCLN